MISARNRASQRILRCFQQQPAVSVGLRFKAALIVGHAVPFSQKCTPRSQASLPRFCAATSKEPATRQKINPLWVKVKNGAAAKYNRDDFDDVSELLKEVKQDNPTLLGAADRSRLKLYQTESDEEVLRPGMMLSAIDGGKDDEHPLYVDYPDQSAPAEASEASYLYNLVQKADRSLWARPTPMPRRFHENQNSVWPGTQMRCPGLIPLAQTVDDGRSTLYGIGNAFGTGKTEVAVRSAEATRDVEPNVEVAYMSFSNGYVCSTLIASTTDQSIVRHFAGKEFRYSRYVGVWLKAALLATRVNGGEVQGHSELFRAVVEAYAAHPEWDLPNYGDLVDRNLVVIIDEVQALPFGCLDALVTLEAAPAVTRATLLVGAFVPRNLFSSGHRVRDILFTTYADAVVEKIFLDWVPGAPTRFEGVHLPGLLGGCVRPLIRWITTQQQLRDPVSAFLERYSQIMGRPPTSAILVRAAFADLPVGEEVFIELFHTDTSSLGYAFVSRVTHRAGRNAYEVQLPPSHVASAQLTVPDAADTFTESKLRRAIEGFCDPTWSQFEAILGLAPAFRIAALSHAAAMRYTLEDRPVLQNIFRGWSNAMADELLLNAQLSENLVVRQVRGGRDVRKVGRRFQDSAAEEEVVTMTMEKDHDAYIDHFIIVPCNGEFLLICIDSKFSEEGGAKHLNFSKDVEPKVIGLQKLQDAEVIPEAWSVLLVIGSNRSMGDVQGEKVRDVDEVALVVVSAENLQNLLSKTFTPPKYRACEHVVED